MAYLTCIGGQGVAGKNSGGAGSRGYWIFRRGQVVVIRYGPVQVRRTKTVRIAWLRRWQEVAKKERSVTAARARINQIVVDKTSSGHGYTRLAPGVKIWPPSR
jgi:hypothetical protein